MKKKPYLKYIGDGSYVPGIPARDLSEGEVDQYTLEDLLATGLYEEVKTAPVKKPASEATWQESENLDP